MTVEEIGGAVEIRNRHGDVVARKIAGGLRVNGRHGAAEVADVVGKVTLDLEHGDLTVRSVGSLEVKQAFGVLTAEGIRGDFDATTEHSDVRAKDVAGSARISSSFGGVRVENVGGDAHLKAEHGAVRAADVKGALTAEATFDGVVVERVGGAVEITVAHGGARARAFEGGARVRAEGDAVTLRDYAGPIDVEARRGDVELGPRSAIVDPISVATDHGTIRLDVPAGSRFALEADAFRGEMDIEVEGLKTARSGEGRLTGDLGGGGSRVLLRARHGDVHLSGRAGRTSP
jgi:hypothetical protein